MAILLKKRHTPAIHRRLALCGLLVFLCYGCATVEPPPTPPGQPKPYKIGKNWYQPLAHAQGFNQRGRASWYGRDFHGRKTSNGETYNMYAMTAAHKTLPFGTYVSVHNLENNRKIDVRINDRGPFARGRIIDLSYTAAKKLGIVGPGTADVEIIALGTPNPSDISKSAGQSYSPSNYYQGNFTIQIGAFSEWANAERLREKLARSHKNVHIKAYFDGNATFYRVRVGKYSSLEEADRNEEFMIQNGYKNAYAIAMDN
jgi:rare lipoprotein A